MLAIWKRSIILEGQLSLRQTLCSLCPPLLARAGQARRNRPCASWPRRRPAAVPIAAACTHTRLLEENLPSSQHENQRSALQSGTNESSCQPLCARFHYVALLTKHCLYKRNQHHIITLQRNWHNCCASFILFFSLFCVFFTLEASY